MQGTLTINRDIITKGVPEVIRLIEGFVSTDDTYTVRDVPDQHSYEYTLDHPDFDVEDGQYSLVLATLRDPAQFMNRVFIITKLQRRDASGTFITVKEYILL